MKRKKGGGGKVAPLVKGKKGGKTKKSKRKSKGGKGVAGKMLEAVYGAGLGPPHSSGNAGKHLRHPMEKLPTVFTRTV